MKKFNQHTQFNFKNKNLYVIGGSGLLGSKIAEFFLCNKPILCNNFNYDMESVTDYKRGLLFDDKLPINEEYIKILKKLINDNLYNEYCRKYAIKNLTLDKIFVKILKCYQSIV